MTRFKNVQQHIIETLLYLRDNEVIDFLERNKHAGIENNKEVQELQNEIEQFAFRLGLRLTTGAEGGDFCIISHQDLMELRIKAGHYSDLSDMALDAVRKICVSVGAEAPFVDDAVRQAIALAYDRGRAGESLIPKETENSTSGA